MDIYFKYNKEKQDIHLILDDEFLYEELCDELEEFKESLSDDFEAYITVDEINKKFECKSGLTGNTFSGGYRNLDADEVCYWLHEVADMDNVFIWIEEFHGGDPITVLYDESTDEDFDE